MPEERPLTPEEEAERADLRRLLVDLASMPVAEDPLRLTPRQQIRELRGLVRVLADEFARDEPRG